MANMTWSSLRTVLRRSYLKDVAGKKWEDEVLLDFANAALVDLSGHAPAPKIVTLVFGAGSLGDTTTPLPEDLMRIDAIWWSAAGEAPTLVPEHELGDALPDLISEDSSLSYLPDYEVPDTLTFFRALPASVKLCYGSWRTPLTADSDSLPIGANLWMEPAICCYVAMRANLREGVSAASLEQWKQKPDLAVGNPLNLDAYVWAKEYQRLVRENKPRGQK